LNQENNELKVKYNELKLKFVKAEREKEVNRKCRDFVGRLLLNYQRN
jgi:hypothetical protein